MIRRRPLWILLLVFATMLGVGNATRKSVEVSVADPCSCCCPQPCGVKPTACLPCAVAPLPFAWIAERISNLAYASPLVAGFVFAPDDEAEGRFASPLLPPPKGDRAA